VETSGAALAAVMEMTNKRSSPAAGGLFLEHSKTLHMRRRELDRYLIELVEQKTWIEGVRFMLAAPDTPQRLWPCYRDEHSLWVGPASSDHGRGFLVSG
jgi:hypothetical protein